MKLKEGFILHDVGEEHMVVATGRAGKIFNGLVRNNDTANFIYQQLMSDTTEEYIIDAMAQKYNASKELIAKDVHEIIGQIRKAGFIDE